MQDAEYRAVRPRVYSAPFGTDLAEATVRMMIADSDPVTISQAIIFLPNNRAVRTMTEAFVRGAAPGLLLPRMVAIGDLALDEALGPVLDPLADDEPVFPVISPTRRLMLLAGLVMKFHTQRVTPAEALRLACKLVEMIDELEIEEVGFDRFDDITNDADLAGHWQSAYCQLMDIMPAYRAAMAEIEVLGPSERRNILLDRLATRLRNAPPSGPVVAAGITTSAKAVARVLRRIAHLPQGAVILPGIDLDVPEPIWEALGPHKKVEGEISSRRNQETHPQFHLKLLIDRMGIRRSEIETLPGTFPSAKRQAIADMFCLPGDSCEWRDLPEARKQMPHVAVLEASDSAEEARAIAIKVRGALEQRDKRIAIVTPDRELAVRVSAQLRRWNIGVDDSAGTPLLQTPPGTLIAALAEAIASDFSPVSILTIAKHPLVHAGEERLAWLEQARALDLLLRGPSRGRGLDTLAAIVAEKSKNTDLRIWWTGLEATLAPMRAANRKSFTDVFEAVRVVADDLTQGQIWRGTTGRQLACCWEEIASCDLSAIGGAEPAAVPALFSELFGRAVVRPPYGGHPRVAIYGLLEARMQQADLVICCGLNEGTWPQVAKPDPWLAPAIRRHFELATLDRNIGLSAHDLSVALGADEVLVTRAKRDRGGPTVASRFVLRLKALLGDRMRIEAESAEYAGTIDKPSMREPMSQRPAPMPNPEQRRVSLSITDFDQLKSDPYSFYAKRILGLRPLEPVDADPSYAWRGTVVHDVLEAWFKQDRCAPEALARRADKLLTDAALDPILRALWQPRVAEGLKWIAQETAKLQQDEGRVVLTAEQSGHIELAGIKISGRADRIDRLADGCLVIIDYKTGQAPSRKQAAAGFAMQLGLVGLMAERGAIENISGRAGRFEYWSLAKGKGSFGYVIEPTSKKKDDSHIDAADFVAFTTRQAEGAIANWIVGTSPFTSKLRPEYANYEDYDQLARVQEWNGRQSIAESDGR